MFVSPAGFHRSQRKPVSCVQQRFLATVVEKKHRQDAHLFDLPGPSAISALSNYGDQDMGWIRVVLLNGPGF